MEGTAAGASLDHPELFAALKPGDQIWMDDGTIQLAVQAVGAGEARCRVTAGGVVSDHKGVALPGLPLPLSCLTAKDKEDLRFGIEHGVDYVAVSFVRSASDIQEVRKFLLDQRASLPIIAKLERAEIVANLPGILALVDAVMVARGDLGVEVPIEEVPIIQRDVIRQARRGQGAGHRGDPDAGVDGDVSAAHARGGERRRHRHLRGRGRPHALRRDGLRPAPRGGGGGDVAGGRPRGAGDPAGSTLPSRPEAYGFPEAVAEAACRAAQVLHAKTIVAFTQSGFSARLISSERPQVPVVALTPFPEVQRRLGLYWGVSSRLIRKVETTDEMVHEVEATLLGDGTVRNGDVIVIISGAPMWVTGTTNLLKLHRIGDRR